MILSSERRRAADPRNDGRLFSLVSYELARRLVNFNESRSSDKGGERDKYVSHPGAAARGAAKLHDSINIKPPASSFTSPQHPPVSAMASANPYDEASRIDPDVIDPDSRA